jgi:predicted PurR-regulated permease PerM
VAVALQQRSVVRTTLLVLLIISIWVVLAWVVVLSRHFFFLILLAWLIAIAAEPAIRLLTRHRWRRGPATAAVGGTVLVVVAGTAALFGALMFGQAGQLVADAPAIVQSGVEQLNSSFGLTLNAVEIVARMRDVTTNAGAFVATYGTGLLGAAESLGSVLLDLATVIVFAFYIAAAGPTLVRTLAGWLPPERQRVLGDLWEIATDKTGGYVASRVILSALSAVFHGAFFWAIGLPGWLPLALLVGVTAQFVPIVGTYIGVLVPGVVALADQPISALWIVLFAVVYQQIETYVFTPRVSQRTMDVNSGIALAAVFVGAAIWGPIGAVIGVPITAVITAMIDTYGPHHEVVPDLASAGGQDPSEEDDHAEDDDPSGRGRPGTSFPG